MNDLWLPDILLGRHHEYINFAEAVQKYLWYMKQAYDDRKVNDIINLAFAKNYQMYLDTEQPIKTHYKMFKIALKLLDTYAKGFG